MKPSRKLSRRSFVLQVSGGNPAGVGAPGGQVKAASDHDLGQPGGGKPTDPDSGPEGGR
ncbi:MAG: hypothetical protein QOG13_2996 [Sphingomonadales bacterium]|jgi:hypothetical protein|nr:hypothetical protein [Sphingomonadales bacterium]MEA3045180.1 hypothetical protein [Sphingomonadales bacterium]